MSSGRGAGGSSSSGSDPPGMLTDTHHRDCAVCCTDLFMSAVVSSQRPGTAVCLQHVDGLGASPDTCTLLTRWVGALWAQGTVLCRHRYWRPCSKNLLNFPSGRCRSPVQAFTLFVYSCSNGQFIVPVCLYVVG